MHSKAYVKDRADSGTGVSFEEWHPSSPWDYTCVRSEEASSSSCSSPSSG